MLYKNYFLNLCIAYAMFLSVFADNNMTADEIEKRRSVREFFDSLVAGSNQNSKSTQNSNSQTTQRPQPVFMPFAVPMHSPPPMGGMGPMGPPGYGYPTNMYRPPPPPRPMGYAPVGHPTQNYGIISQPSHSFAPIGPPNHNYGQMMGSPSHNFGIIGPPNHYDYGQHSRPIAIAIPVPLHAIPFSYGPHPDEAHRAYGSQHNYLSNSDFGDEMSGSTKYALFADPFDDSDEDFIDSSNRRFKVIPVEMNE